MSEEKKKTEEQKRVRVAITPPNFQTAIFTIQGTTPYVQNRFGARDDLMRSHEEGSVGKNKKKRTPKNFNALYEKAKHRAEDGWCGIPAGAFRAAMISACRVVGFKMTLAKLSVFVDEDGFDKEDGTPLVRITGKERRNDAPVRNFTGVIDIRARPMWSPGWSAKVRIRWDADQFSLTDVTNLLARVGGQVGIGEGRADSRESVGVGWGHFRVLEAHGLTKAAA
jgi:hypothetical protein